MLCSRRRQQARRLQGKVIVPDRIAYFLRRPNIPFVEGFDAPSIWTLEEAVAKDLLATHYAKFAKEDENMDDDA